VHDLDDPTGLAPVVKKAGCCGATPLFQRLPPPAQGRWAEAEQQAGAGCPRLRRVWSLARLHGRVGVEYRIDFRLSRIYSVVMTDLKFEWDERKNHENQRKHGVSFEEARSVFYDQQAVEFYDDEHEEMEDRFLLLGVSGRLRILMICHCLRQNGDVIRIISARKATRNEEREYPWGAS
jgi:uncharacterized DUF497 family protein